MKKIALSLALPLAMLLMAPNAQAQDEALKKKTDEQLKEELERLSKDISKGMGEVRDDLYKAALPRRKMDELRAEFDGMMKKLKKGEADELHEGMKAYLKANPDKLAELLDMTREEAEELLKSDKDLLKRLGEHADKTAELFRDASLLEDVLKRQAELDEKMESVRKAFEKGKENAGQLEKVLDLLQEAERRAKPKPGKGNPNQGDPQPGEQPGEKDGEGKDKGKKPGQNPGDTPGDQGLQDSGGDSRGNKPEDEAKQERDLSGDTADLRLQGKDAKQAENKAAERKPDPKYDGMKNAFNRLRKKQGK